MALVRIFVYGSLRPEAGGWGKSAYAGEPVPATANGILYDYGPFPYAVFCSSQDGGTTMQGDVLTLDTEHPFYSAIHGAEIGAGYESKRIVVTYADGSKEAVRAYAASTSTVVDLLPRLPVVASGDWVAYLRERGPWRRLVSH